MPACSNCGEGLDAAMNYCPACGRPARPEAVALRATSQKVFLEDLYHHCERCGKEEVYGRLTKCAPCADRVCGECVKVCAACGEPACLKCLLDCAECKKTGCSRCFERCESCYARAMCPEHALACEDCGFATCEGCMRFCQNCDLEVCAVCLDEAHEKTARKHS